MILNVKGLGYKIHASLAIEAASWGVACWVLGFGVWGFGVWGLGFRRFGV